MATKKPRLINLWALLCCVMVLTIGGGGLGEEKKEELKVAADLFLRNGKEVKLTNVLGNYSLKLLWGSFELEITYYDIQKGYFSGTPSVKDNIYTLEARVQLHNGMELEGLAEFYKQSSIRGDWEFGTRSISWEDVSSVAFWRTAGHPGPVLKPIGIVTDQKGKTIQMVSLPDVDANQRTWVQEKIFGTDDTTKYFALPCGGGYVFMPFSDIVEVVGKEGRWEVQKKDGKRLLLAVVEGGPVKAITGKSTIGEFSLKPLQLRSLKFERHMPLAEKPKIGLASEPTKPIFSNLFDNFGLTYKLQGIQFYTRVSHYGLWLPRAPSDYSNISENMNAKLSDGSDANIAFSRLLSVSFKDGQLQSITSKAGKTIEAKLDLASGRGWSTTGEGFVGLVTIDREGRYWGYFPLGLIKSIQFE